LGVEKKGNVRVEKRRKVSKKAERRKFEHISAPGGRRKGRRKVRRESSRMGGYGKVKRGNRKKKGGRERETKARGAVVRGNQERRYTRKQFETAEERRTQSRTRTGDHFDEGGFYLPQQ